MVVGVCTVELFIAGSQSLKDKRQVVRSVLDRMRGAFNVSAAEVGTHDDVKLITLGFAAVGFETAAVRGTLQRIQEALRAHPVAEYLGGEIAVGGEVV